MISIGVTFDGNVTVSSNMSYLMKGLSEMYILIVGIDVVSLPFNRLELGYRPLPNVLLCSSNFTYEKYLSLFVCLYHHFIVTLLLL